MKQKRRAITARSSRESHVCADWEDGARGLMHAALCMRLYACVDDSIKLINCHAGLKPYE